LFTKQELREAESRLKTVPRYAKRLDVSPERNYPDELPDKGGYNEGAKKQVTVNAYERDSRARRACVRKYGYKCQACGMEFSRTYGPIGRKFIHVHHKIPLAARKSNYRVQPLKDLVPVCPNCHAMLHTKNPPLGIEELKQMMAMNG
jgi:5-methylcytosine-specific restriction protein A